MAELAAGVAAVLVRAVMWRLAWLERRPVTARMKRGQPRRWWLAAPVVLVAAGVVWWFGHPDVARWMLAATCGAPFLLGTERHWGRALSVDTAGWDGNINMGALAASAVERKT